MEVLIFGARVPLTLLQFHQCLMNTVQTSSNFNMTDFSFETRRR